MHTSVVLNSGCMNDTQGALLKKESNAWGSFRQSLEIKGLGIIVFFKLFFEAYRFFKSSPDYFNMPPGLRIMTLDDLLWFHLYQT